MFYGLVKLIINKTESGELWYWGGLFFRKAKRNLIEGFNLLNEEKEFKELLEGDERIIDMGLGFAHDLVMTERPGVEITEEIEV